MKSFLFLHPKNQYVIHHTREETKKPNGLEKFKKERPDKKQLNYLTKLENDVVLPFRFRKPKK